jgi:hypothetical protein
MKERELNRAHIGVAKTTAMSGRATADETNRGLRTGKERSFWRIASLTFLGSLTVAGLLIAIAPLRADEDKDKRHEHEDNDKEIRAEIAALKAQVADLQNQVSSLQTSNATLQSQLTAVQSNHALLLGPFVTVDPNPKIGVRGPNIIFSGANIHIVSGSGSTNDNGNRTGLGNLIIGYDEDPGMAPVPAFPPLKPGDRGGSHNLVIGRWHRFTQAAFGGFIAGEANFIMNEGASVSGGFTNTASGVLASVTGGQDNTASGFQASVTGGQANVASGEFASVSGGASNTARGFLGSAVSGGSGNTASGNYASVSGGHLNISSADGSIVLGGINNNAGGLNSVVIGGQNITDSNDNSIAPKAPYP